jgi:hypothetical protein
LPQQVALQQIRKLLQISGGLKFLKAGLAKLEASGQKISDKSRIVCPKISEIRNDSEKIMLKEMLLLISPNVT